MPTRLKTAHTRSVADAAREEVSQRVRGIIADIRVRGEAAVRKPAGAPCVDAFVPSVADRS
jgi:hypothetical protein